MTQRTHGHTARGESSPTYQAWAAMRHRCLRPSNPRFADYGGRGITVCERWSSFAAFLSDMGERPNGMQIDRIDNDGNYEPSNCRWATAKEQTRNRRNNRLLTIDGATKCLAQWSELSGVGYAVIRARLTVLKWEPKRAVFQPERRYGK